MEPSGRDAGRPPGREPDLRRARPLSDLSSAAVPPPGPADHVRGSGNVPLVIAYADFECPFCAVLAIRLEAAGIGHVFRHFPVRSSHPRAWAAAAAAEAAGLQGQFWEMHDRLFADQARLEDPHLWERARSLGLDLERFDSDRRSDGVLAAVRRDFQSGVRAGVVTTPTVFAGGAVHTGRIGDAQLAAWAAR